MDEAAYRAAESALWAHHGIDPVERFVTARGTGTRVRAVEFGEGRPVVLVHGMPTAGGVFAPLVAALTGVRAIVVDRPGCGLSDPLELSGLTPERLTEANEAWLEAVVEQVAGEPVDLLGSSAGGMAAVSFAARRPELVRSITLDGVPALRGMRLPVSMRAATFGPVAKATVRHRVVERDLRRSMRQMGHGEAFDDGRLSQADLDWRLAVARHTQTMRHDLALLGRVASWRGPRAEWAPGPAHVRALSMPSLWVAGDRDPFASPDRVRAWARHAPQPTVRIVRTGHQPWIDGAAEHAALLTQWWARSSARAA
ncbi:alpha/beta hydrolase [Demequina activiva]|uniref:Alpha/beta hydrolase n=1 Tax=Demequina activiva TaxID=1582364 RepID=A0A919Q2S8_9MICO|nr:alpha/beta hydrolase [Demequina activiva]